MRNLSLAVLAAAVMTVSAPAVAETPADAATLSVTVPLFDLDLSKPAGTKALETRVSRAAERVCDRPDVRELSANKAFENCKAEARDTAMEQLSLANPFYGVALASLF